MQLQQEIVEKLKVIVPRWTKKILDNAKQDPTDLHIPCEIDGIELNMQNYGCCIVGEAYGFCSNDFSRFDPYRCDICKVFSEIFDDIVDDDPSVPFISQWAKKYSGNVHSIEAFEEQLTKFIEHVEEKHSEMLKKDE